MKKLRDNWSNGIQNIVFTLVGKVKVGRLRFNHSFAEDLLFSTSVSNETGFLD